MENKNCIVTSAYHNIGLKPNVRETIVKMFREFSDKSEVDFIDYDTVPIFPELDALKRQVGVTGEGSTMQTHMNKFAILDDAFSRGYDWVAWMDADVVIHPDAKNFFSKNYKKNAVYLLKVNDSGPRKNFESTKLDEFVDIFTQYGNTGVTLLHKDIWVKIKSVLLEFDISKYARVDTIYAVSDQAVLALVLNSADIEMNVKFLHRWAQKYLFHLKWVQGYSDYAPSASYEFNADICVRLRRKLSIILDMIEKLSTGTLDLKKYFPHKH